MIDISKSGEREVKAVLKAIGVECKEDTPRRDAIWQLVWVSILFIRLRDSFERRREECKERKESA